MADQPWFPFFWKDWLASTRGMSADAKGCYIDFLAHAWSTGGLPLDSEERRRIAGIDRAQWRRVWPQLESRWVESGGRLVNLRQEDVRRKQAAASKAGKASVEARLRANGSAQPAPIRSNGIPNKPTNDSPNDTPNTARTEPEQEPEPTRVQSTDKKRSPLPPKGEYPPDFERFWSAYPNGTDPENPRRAGKAKAFKAWQKLNPDEAFIEALFAALEWQRKTVGWTKDDGAFIPYPATWLNQRRWEDERPFDLAEDDEDDAPLPPYNPVTRPIEGW